MDIEEFVADAIGQIERGLNKVSSVSKERIYRFNATEGINFDLAVTHTTNKSGSAGAGVKSGIKIIDFEVGGKGSMSVGQEVAQRIQFRVMPSQKNEQGPGVVTAKPAGGAPIFRSTDRY